MEFARNSIHVNALIPGGTDTAMYRTMNFTREAQEFIIGLIAVRGLAAAGVLIVGRRDRVIEVEDQRISATVTRARKLLFFMAGYEQHRAHGGPLLER